MALKTQWFSFAAPPKCACTWMLSALGEAGVTVERFGSTRVHLPETFGGLPSITFIRDPVDWLRSYYQNQKARTCNNPAVDKLQTLDFSSFRKFADGYLQLIPGHVTQVIFPSYASDYMIDLTDLPGKLIDVFETFHVRYSREAIEKFRPTNVTDERIVIPVDLLARLQEAEGLSSVVPLPETS